MPAVPTNPAVPADLQPDHAPPDRPKKSGKRRTQAQRTAASDEKLLEAALKLIGERGYRATTLAAIGEEAGYSRGLVSHRYGSKEGLLGALAQRVIESWEADHSVQASRGNHEGRFDGEIGVAGLCALLDAVAAEARARPDELRVLNAVLFDPAPELRATAARLHSDLRNRMTGLLRLGIEAGETRADIDPEVQATLFVSTLRGALYQWTLEPDALDLDQIFQELRVGLRSTLSAGARSAN